MYHTYKHTMTPWVETYFSPKNISSRKLQDLNIHSSIPTQYKLFAFCEELNLSTARNSRPTGLKPRSTKP